MNSNEERTWGMLSHLITLVVNALTGFSFGWIAGIVIWAIKGRDSRFVAFHALQASLFQLAMAGLIWLMVCLVITAPIALVFGIMGIILPIYAMLKANGGSDWGYPFVGGFCRRAAGL